jgi:hypothetical protein
MLGRIEPNMLRPIDQACFNLTYMELHTVLKLLDVDYLDLALVHGPSEPFGYQGSCGKEVCAFMFQATASSCIPSATRFDCTCMPSAIQIVHPYAVTDFNAPVCRQLCSFLSFDHHYVVFPNSKMMIDWGCFTLSDLKTYGCSPLS